ncbi:rhomboid family intramembrane serine protease [Bdellovibrionota bacterium FG-1]
MIGAIGPFAAAAALGTATHWVLQNALRSNRSKKAATQRRKLSADEARHWITEFGRSANSFMTLYPGFEFFTHPDPLVRGMIAFSEQPHAWVGGAEPFCAPSDRERLLQAFAQAAGQLGKTAILLPVDENHAQFATPLGYRAFMIGTEPTFDLKRYPRTGRTWIDVVPTAKVLASKGAKVTEVTLSELDPAERIELETITQEWLASRKMPALGFLNQVDPWFSPKDKRYFKIETGGRVVAFLAAIPIWARKGWYLIDLLRKNDSPAGSTELLLLQSMRILSESGALEVTMGVAPLSGLEKAPQTLITRFLRLIYEHGNTFYHFKPLYQYKLKFDPSSYPPMFLICHGPLGIRVLLSLARAFMPAGVTRATASGVIRAVMNFDLAEWIRSQISSSVIVRSTQLSWRRLLYRCKFTSSMIALNLLIFSLTVNGSGKIIPEIEAHWGFSWNTFVVDPFKALALSPLLHWNPFHLSFNLVGLVFFTGGLEYLAGSALTLIVYLPAMWLANPMTSALLVFAIKPWWGAVNPAEIDIGTSLGIFGCAGALTGFLKRGKWVAGILVLSVIFDSITRSSFMTLNHCVALSLGVILARGWLKD